MEPGILRGQVVAASYPDWRYHASSSSPAEGGEGVASLTGRRLEDRKRESRCMLGCMANFNPPLLNDVRFLEGDE